MVEKVNKSCHPGNVHLDEHHPDNSNTKMKPAEDRSLLGPVYKQIFRSRAVFPVLLMAAVQASTLFCEKLQVPGFFSNVVKVDIPSTVDTHTIFLALVAVGLVYLAYYLIFIPGPILLLDFACFKPDDSTKLSKQIYFEKAKKSGFFTQKSLEFQEKVLALSGLGDETHVPPSLICEPVDRSLKACHSEAQTVIFGVTDELFSHGTMKPKDIDILVVNCSMYSPVPSLAAMVINRYRMRKDIEVFNLGGMGCSAGLIAVDLAKTLLQGRRNSYALVISTEIIGSMFGYTGNNRSMMVGNCLFRTGCAGVLLSNCRADRWRAKYELQHLVRTHNGADDASYKCVHSEQDEQGHIGISLSRDLMRAAGSVLKDNITTLAPRILPLSEKLKFAINYISMKLSRGQKPAIKAYVPNFKKAVSHFVVHPGGRAVLEGVAEKLELGDWYMEPSRMTLHRFGNTSSSSVWYVLAYLEAKGRVKQGDRVWQIALGSGLKCNSAVWKSLRTSQQGPSTNAWAQFIDKYPMEIDTTLPPQSTTKSDSA